MVRKTAFLFVVIALLLGGVAHAGDIPESLLSGDRKAMLIGRITAIGQDTITIEPLTVMMGQAGPGELTVKRFDSYSFDPHPPRKGDYLIVLLLNDTTIDETWVFECTTADYSALEIVGAKYNIVTRYQKLINDGAYIEAQKRLDERNASGTPAPTLRPTAAPPGESSPIPSSSPTQSLASSPAPSPTPSTNPSPAHTAGVLETPPVSAQPAETPGALAVAAGQGGGTKHGGWPSQSLLTLCIIGFVLVCGIVLILVSRPKRKPD